MFEKLRPAFSSVPPALREQTYLVGGAVRDHLLELPVRECDWVVVGSSAEQLQALGFREAGPGVPVYLHPQTGEEFALARRETKTGPGYHGFLFDTASSVTLEQDLQRRDFTVNAMALDAQGRLHDPFGGQDDVADARLRHVGPAFTEDPLRVLRAARFAAKLGSCGFRLAHATNALMRRMVADGAIDEWQPQRTGEELRRAMSTSHPWRFFEVLLAADALQQWLPCLAEAMTGVADGTTAHQQGDSLPIRVLQTATRHSSSSVERLAAVLLAAGDGCRISAQQASVEHQVSIALEDGDSLRRHDELSPVVVLEWFQRIRAWQDRPRFERVYRVLSAQPEGARYRMLAAALDAAGAVNAAAFQAQGVSGRAIGEAVAQGRLAAITEILAN